MTFASLFGSVFFGLVEALWLDPDSSLGHAALVGCRFGMVLSALELVRHLATRVENQANGEGQLPLDCQPPKGGVNRLRTVGRPRSRMSPVAGRGEHGSARQRHEPGREEGRRVAAGEVCGPPRERGRPQQPRS